MLPRAWDKRKNQKTPTTFEPMFSQIPVNRCKIRVARRIETAVACVTTTSENLKNECLLSQDSSTLHDIAA